VCVCVHAHFGLQLFEAYRSAVVCDLEKGMKNTLSAGAKYQGE